MVKITSGEIEFSSTNIQKSVFPYIGTILLWGGYAINGDMDGYLLCNGQELNIVEYPELYNVIGTTYGGSGTVFKVPNLKKRFPLSVDNSTNMSYKSTVSGGVKQLTNAHFPHSHSFSFNEVAGNDRRGAETEGGNRFAAVEIKRATATITIASNESIAQKDYYPKYCIVNYIIRAK
jgi:microcystin-dependent protein